MMQFDPLPLNAFDLKPFPKDFRLDNVELKRPVEVNPVLPEAPNVKYAAPVNLNSSVKKICLKTFLSAGDVVCLTVAPHCLVEQFPGQYEIFVTTSCEQFWENNPHVKVIKYGHPIPSDVQVIDCEYKGIHKCNQSPVQMLSDYTVTLGEQLNIPLKCSTNKPWIYLSDEERAWISQVHQHVTNKPVPYFLISPHIKKDYTAKAWCHWDKLVELISPFVQVVTIGAADGLHQTVKGTIDLTGQTDLRQLARLVAHRDCVGACGAPSLLMWLSAAFDKQFWLLNGGREPLSWNQGVNSRHIFSTIGQLACCGPASCWRSRVMPLNDGDQKDSQLCESPVLYAGLPVAKCMASISAEEVALSIQRYFVNRSTWAK